jgi:hypothetical protein
MAAKKALPEMKPCIFAEYHPAVIAVFPHANLPGAMALIGWENQRLAAVKLQAVSSRLG